MKLIKRIIALIMIVSTLVLSSCSHFEMNQYAGMQMDISDDCAVIIGYNGNLENVYFPPVYEGSTVKYIKGMKSFYWETSRIASFSGPNLQRVYFPWCMHSSNDGENDILYKTAPGVAVIFARNDDIFPARNIIVSQLAYQKYLEKEMIGGYPISKEFIQPANVSYLFNYPGAPNSNYYFIDLIESTGKLQKPPYDPERKGYAFRGWYKDAECTEPWDFENDIVEVSYDKYGRRIYDELCLYAKWEIAVPVMWLYNYPDAPSKNVFLKTLEVPETALSLPEEIPTRDGYIFVGWYKDADCTLPFDSSFTIPDVEYNNKTGQRIYKDIWFYAKWEKINWWEFWK